MLKLISYDKHTSLLGAFVNYKENEVLSKRPLSQYSQHFIFLLT